MTKWYEDADVCKWMKSVGLTEVEKGRWEADNRNLQDFGSGMSIQAKVLAEDPRFDVETIHLYLADEEPMVFLARAIKEHTEELKHRTELLRDKGIAAVENRSKN